MQKLRRDWLNEAEENDADRQFWKEKSPAADGKA